jgi:hypothetical protein
MNSEASEPEFPKAVATLLCAKSGVDFVNAAKRAFVFRRKLILLVDVSPGSVDVRGEEPLWRSTTPSNSCPITERLSDASPVSISMEVLIPGEFKRDYPVDTG